MDGPAVDLDRRTRPGRPWAVVVVLVVAVLAGLAVFWLWPRQRHATDGTEPNTVREPRSRPAAPERRPTSTTAGSGESASDAGLDLIAAGSPTATDRGGPALPSPSGPTPAGPSCDDGDPCTFDDRYADGVCRGRPLQCDDDNPLTIDTCTGDGCRHAFVSKAFDPPTVGIP